MSMTNQTQAQKMAGAAMLATLSVSLYSGRKVDREATGTVHSKYQTGDVGTYNKEAIASSAFSEMRGIAHAARAFHYKHTLPWWDDGSRLLTSKMFEEYRKEMSRFKGQFEAEVQKFISNFPNHLTEAKNRLKGLFRAEDYPDMTTLKGMFSFNLFINPMPTGNDVRVNLQENEIRKIREEVEARLVEAGNESKKELWRRLYKPVANMVEKLGNENSQMRSNIVNDIANVTAILPKLNVLDDPELEEMRKEIENKLTHVSSGGMKANPRVRKEVFNDAEKIMDKMAGYMNPSRKEDTE